MKFSKRTQWDTEESELARAHRERVESGKLLFDLTVSNPTRCGLTYSETLLDGLRSAEALVYDPQPLGKTAARQAVAAYYLDHGAVISASNILLTASTSEGYSYLFKLLGNPGDEILVPQPSYPLFDFLGDVEVVQVKFVPMVYDHGWQLDVEGLRRRVTERTRAVVLVHPNNPTGHFTKVAEARELAELCRERGLALIVDEVFLDFGFGESAEDQRSFLSRDLGILTFVVSGISKVCGLPQMKVAWVAATGPGSGEAMARLEVVADIYLSMNAPVQAALPAWLKDRRSIQEQIRLRARRNLDCVDRELANQSAGERLVNRLEVEGGWYVVLRIPAIDPDERTVKDLLEEGVWVHPGHFFGFGSSGWLVLSLLTPEDEFQAGMRLLLRKLLLHHRSYLKTGS